MSKIAELMKELSRKRAESIKALDDQLAHSLRSMVVTQYVAEVCSKHIAVIGWWDNKECPICAEKRDIEEQHEMEIDHFKDLIMQLESELEDLKGKMHLP